MNVLIKFRHGLGDAAQLTLVLKHLQQEHPDWNIDVAALPGKHSIFHGLCHEVFMLNEEELASRQYDRVFNLEWPECATCYANWPQHEGRTLPPADLRHRACSREMPLHDLPDRRGDPIGPTVSGGCVHGSTKPGGPLSGCTDSLRREHERPRQGLLAQDGSQAVRRDPRVGQRSRDPRLG